MRTRKLIRKKFSTTLHTQFNYLTQPVTPFRKTGKGSKFVKLYVGIKNGLNLENPITYKSIDYYSPFFRHPVVQSNNYLYYKTRHSYLYMLPIAVQTAGPNLLKLFVNTYSGVAGGCFRLKNIFLVKKSNFFKNSTGNAGALQLVRN